MSIVLVVVLGASALAFLGCFFLGICRDGRHAKDVDVVEVVRLSESGQAKEPGFHEQESA